VALDGVKKDGGGVGYELLLI